MGSGQRPLERSTTRERGGRMMGEGRGKSKDKNGVACDRDKKKKTQLRIESLRTKDPTKVRTSRTQAGEVVVG